MKPKQSIRRVSLDHLVNHPGNPPERLDFESVSELADSIREHGILQPLVVTEHLTEPDRWTILAGHRRAAAARLAGLHEVPCVVRHGLDEAADEQLVVMLVENCQRKDLAPMERAEMLGVLRDRQGLSLVEISRRTGLSAGRVSESLSLLELDGETRERVRAGDVGVGQATQAIRQVRAAHRTGAVVGKHHAKPSTGIRVEAAHFTSKHPLADTVRKTCEHLDASAATVRPPVGGMGCGQCWERVIRDDELSKLSTSQGVSA
jgi:ParB family chromosome partitioning protein